MASLIPVIKDLIPIIMPGEVQVTKSTELSEGTGQTEGMIRKGAIVGKSDKICGSVMIAKPHTSSAIHHHGEQDTIVYAASGHGTIITNPSSTNPSDISFTHAASSSSGIKRHDLAPGDFALIPAYAEHQEVNDGEEEVVWIITRSGGTPVVVNLEGWGGKEAK